MDITIINITITIPYHRIPKLTGTLGTLFWYEIMKRITNF